MKATIGDLSFKESFTLVAEEYEKITLWPFDGLVQMNVLFNRDPDKPKTQTALTFDPAPIINLTLINHEDTASSASSLFALGSFDNTQLFFRYTIASYGLGEETRTFAITFMFAEMKMGQ